jgi:dihydrofolate reductase
VAKLVYSAIVSLDGYICDEDGDFDWAEPDDELHAFVNDLERPIGTYLYGRRMYEVMSYWESPPITEDASPVHLDYARIWQAADKIVYSKALERVTTARTTIERDLDPAAVRTLKSSASSDLSIGGASLAADAFRAGLVDECHLFLVPVLAGGGTPALPRGVRLRLELLAERRFGNGVVGVHYAVGDDLPRRPAT